ncbi:MAG TPA: hypothetical protein VFZ65_00145 [Planctomycetota bacterium]|nr:hypothetical protein [Planctomycetota bacterium]
MRVLPLLCSSLCLLALARAQDLRRGLVDANAVVVGRQVGKTAHDEDVVLHRVQVLLDVRGAAGNQAVTVLDWPRLSLHQRPTPRQSRLYCLQDATSIATRLGLPSANGPYYKMVGWPGSNPLVGADLATDPYVRLARLLAASEDGASPTDTAAALCAFAVQGEPVVRTEAACFLTERPDLRARLSAVQWSQLVTRASGEIDDVPHKIALAELCAEQRLDGLLDALAVSLGQVKDAEYARAVGRIGRMLDGEGATAKLEERLRLMGRPEDRAALLLAIGATNTDSALQTLLRLNGAGKDPAVEAALREHHSPLAREAVARRK